MKEAAPELRLEGEELAAEELAAEATEAADETAETGDVAVVVGVMAEADKLK